MRERLLESVRTGSLKDAARRAAPRLVEESVEAPLSPEAERLLPKRATLLEGDRLGDL